MRVSSCLLSLQCFLGSRSPRERSVAQFAVFRLDPAERLCGCGRWLVLQTDPSAVARGSEITEVALQWQCTGTGLVPAGVVGNLHVGDASRVAGNDPVDV